MMRVVSSEARTMSMNWFGSISGFNLPRTPSNDMTCSSTLSNAPCNSGLAKPGYRSPRFHLVGAYVITINLSSYIIPLGHGDAVPLQTGSDVDDVTILHEIFFPFE